MVTITLLKYRYNHEINAEMFLVKVLCSSVTTLFFVSLLSKSFCSDQEISVTERKMGTEPDEALVNPTTKINGNPKESGSKLPGETNPFVYTSQHFNESMEKIQTTNNGMVMKSTFIPIVPNEPGFNYSEFRGENRGHENLDLQRSKSVNTTEPLMLTKTGNENIVIKNGKKYRIVKVKKSVKNVADNQAKTQMQRRTFKPLPNLMSFFPLKWMTRQKKNETEPEVRSENVTQWSKLSPAQNSEEESNEVLKRGVHNSEKIKKLLNLFTIVKFENGECYANGIKGTCLHQMECEGKGGKFAATCAAELGVCCYYERTCGDVSTENSTYFINEGYPDATTIAPKVCTLTLEKIDSDVKQLRLDFEIFQLRGPINGTCLHDRLVISGQDINDVVPEICGTNTGQHIYVDVEDANGPFNLNIVTMGEYFARNFRVKVTQVKKEEELLAPKNCLQYYAEPAGYVQTFNYQQEVNDNLEEVVSGYFNNLNYAICIKKQKGFCSISYENEELDDIHPTFHLVNVDEDGNKLLPPRQAGVETFDCPDDYLVINGIRLCGEKLNDASIDVDYTRNYPVTDTTNGPFILSVRTDSTVSGRGFHLKYTQHPCIA